MTCWQYGLATACVAAWGVLAGEPNPGVPWPATDGLGRSLPLTQEVGAPRSDRFVGMFYFLWHAAHQGRSPHWDGPYDITRILAKDPGALTNSASPYWGPVGMYHYWGEPLFGYYHSADDWVLRRHAMLLADAGVDTLIFDTTNAETYQDVYHRLCEVFEGVRREGGRVPQIAFMVNTQAGATAQRIFEDLYRPGFHTNLWFRWQGKPLMICDPEEATPAVREFFTLRRAHWPFALTNTPNAWHWEATYPQPYGYTEDPSKPEQLTVSVAQNLRQQDGKVTNMSSGDARGRSFHDGRAERQAGAVNHGYNFQEQWSRALELGPPFVMVTGWNEWIAGRWGKPEGPLVFVDQFDQENSRDIEPARVGHGDNYYLQLVANVRRFKGAPALPATSAPQSVGRLFSATTWEGVEPVFRDHVGETRPRDHDGVAGLHYANATGRNDIELCQVARDKRSVFFHVQTQESLSSSAGTNWMWLLIDADQNPATGWEGFDYVVNRLAPGSKGRASLERNRGGWSWEAVGPVSMQMNGRDLVVVIPRSKLGLRSGSTRLALDFKWADNLQAPGDVLDFYLSGDVAPEGRFKYRYTAE